MQRSGFAIPALVLLILFCAIAIAQEDTITIGYSSKMFEEVSFHHAGHANDLKLGCTKCHHTGENVKCIGCHKIETGELPNIKKAFHGLCKECHKQQTKEGKNPPISCTSCHKKKK